MAAPGCHCDSCQHDRIIDSQRNIEGLIMALQDDLQAVVTQLSKGLGEIVGKLDSLAQTIADLQAQVDANSAAAQQLSDAADEIASLKQVAQALDDVVPDAEP